MKTNKQETRLRLEVALQGVKDELASADRGEPALDSKEQLSFITTKLAEMANSLSDISDVKRVPSPGLWRIVTDTWPYQNRLRQQIVEAESAYEKLTK